MGNRRSIGLFQVAGGIILVLQSLVVFMVSMATGEYPGEYVVFGLIVGIPTCILGIISIICGNRNVKLPNTTPTRKLLGAIQILLGSALAILSLQMIFERLSRPEGVLYLLSPPANLSYLGSSTFLVLGVIILVTGIYNFLFYRTQKQ